MSVSTQLVRQGNGRFNLEGILDFSTVPDILRESASQFDGLSELVVDLAGIDKANSAGMALLLEWRAATQSGGPIIQFENIPESIQQIAKVCDVADLINGSTRADSPPQDNP